MCSLALLHHQKESETLLNIKIINRMNSISLLWSLKNVYGLFFGALLVYLVFWYVWYAFKKLANFRHWIRIFAQDQGFQNMRSDSITPCTYRKYQFFTVKSLYLIHLAPCSGSKNTFSNSRIKQFLWLDGKMITFQKHLYAVLWIVILDLVLSGFIQNLFNS